MFIGIDIGGTSIKGILTDKSGKELSYSSILTPDTANKIKNGINSLIETLTTTASVSKMDIKAICIGSAGSIDKKKGIIIASPNIPSLKNYPIVKNLEKITGLKIYLENDATVALIGAWWKGNGSKFRNWLIVTLGTGIGGGAIIDNKIYSGHSGNALEIGHMTIDYNGKECKCGNKGCFEQYASASAIITYVEENISKYKDSSINERLAENEKLSAELIHEEALKSDPLAIEAFEEISKFLGIGIVNLVNIFSPEAIIFAGGLSEAHKLFIPTVKKMVKSNALPGTKENIKFFPIKDQNKIPVLGAVKIAIDFTMNNI